MDINNLTPDQKAQLLKDLEAEQKETAKKEAEEKQALRQLADEFVEQNAPLAVRGQKIQKCIVERIFKNATAYIDLKQKLYGVKEGQASHTITHRGGFGSVVVGYNEIIAFDGNESVGIAKVKEYINTLSADDVNREKLGKIINTLTKANKKGELNPTRIVDLVNLKTDMDSDLFTEGVDIIVDAQFKTRTTMYVRGWMRIELENGKEGKFKFSLTV